MGTLYGVGVGPGDPEDITLKALRVMRDCPVIFLSEASEQDCRAYRIAMQALPEISEKRIVCLSIPMTRKSDVRDGAYAHASGKMLEVLSDGVDAARLTIGDPTVYSTFAELAHSVCVGGGLVEWVCVGLHPSAQAPLL